MSTTPGFATRALAVCGFLLLVSACGGGGGDSAQSGGSGPPGGNNSPPTISGTPQTSVAVGEAYVFQPTASDADGDTLQFTESNLPSWASFDPATGRVSGTPAAGDVNNYPGIMISVSDGKATVSLPAFSISVTQISTGSATVSWVPPTQNEDGSVLTDLARYRVLYGRSSSNLDQSMVVNNAGASTASINNLSPGTWFFGVVAINSAGTESALSNIASKTI